MLVMRVSNSYATKNVGIEYKAKVTLNLRFIKICNTFYLLKKIRPSKNSVNSDELERQPATYFCIPVLETICYIKNMLRLATINDE